MTSMTARRIWLATLMVLSVFLYGTIGNYFFLQGEVALIDCATRTIMMLATINESFTAADIGELYTPAFQVFNLSLVLFGVGAILYSLSTITAFFVEGELQIFLRLRKMSKEISKIHGHVIICGAGETGHYIANEFISSGKPFVLIENSPERIERLVAEKLPYVVGDATEDEVLLQAGIERALGLAVALPTDKDNLFVTISARQLNPNLKIVAKGVDPNTDSKLIKAGANKVVRPALIGGLRMAAELIRPSVVTFLDQMMHDPIDPGRIEEISIQEGSELAGKTMASTRFRQLTGLQVLAWKPVGETRYRYRPDAQTPLDPGTILVVFGPAGDLGIANELALGGEDS